MAEVVIAFRRPPSLSESDMRAWVADLTLGSERALTVCGPLLGCDDLRLRVELDDDSVETGEEELTDLMTDMRLLGLRPAVVATSG